LRIVGGAPNKPRANLNYAVRQCAHAEIRRVDNVEAQTDALGRRRSAQNTVQIGIERRIALDERRNA
jgi:hypothetical protein